MIRYKWEGGRRGGGRRIQDMGCERIQTGRENKKEDAGRREDSGQEEDERSDKN